MRYPLPVPSCPHWANLRAAELAARRGWDIQSWAGTSEAGMVQVRSSIFWPRCASDSPSGFVIGWNPHSFLCSIATVVSDMRLDEVERVLAEVARDPRLQPLMQYCGGPPTVLGVWQHPADAGQRVPIERSHTAQLWLSLVAEPAEDSSGRFLPSLREVYCCGCRYRTTLQLTLFERGGARSTGPAEPNKGPLDRSSPARGEACAAGEETQSAVQPTVERAPSALEYVARHVRLGPPLARGCGPRAPADPMCTWPDVYLTRRCRLAAARRCYTILTTLATLTR